MDKLIESLPEIISAAAQSQLGILALLSISLSLLAYFFFARSSEKVKVGIFVMLFLGVLGFGGAMFRVSAGVAVSTQAVSVSGAALSPEARRLLREAALDRAGLVLFERYGASVDLHTNGQSFVTSKERRELATWEAALEELVKAGLLLARGERGEIYEITRQGYAAAEHLD